MMSGKEDICQTQSAADKRKKTFSPKHETEMQIPVTSGEEA